ncbi:caspase family protein [Rubrivirga marina]|uniref:Peptidase C14 caspase domain-containing protein n=1 Tax=Rubrivirga marina TaxID=1196024 RepID=A0A271IUR8_9BACT|nr:caspase family protein [Rubrivirga marina]PAP74953.1 hypothetical protein BSZ37_00050 [Rubrivirga marina]
MIKRAALCVGVDRANGMMPLQAASKGAREFEAWAKGQGCDTVLLTDEDDRKVRVADLFDAVAAWVGARTYDQLLIYFSGHGILTAPGAEHWFLSGAPYNPSEAVNLTQAVVDARNSAIPHVVFVSDACRSAADRPELRRVNGSAIFPNDGRAPAQGEVDTFYATRPGDPAYEVPEAEAADAYRGLFTDSLLDVLELEPNPLAELQEVGADRLSVVTSRQLKRHLETAVPLLAESVNVTLVQDPEVRVETALPKYFAVLGAARPPASTHGGTRGTGGVRAGGHGPVGTGAEPTFRRAEERFGARFELPPMPASAPRALPDEASEMEQFGEDLGLGGQVDTLLRARGRPHFETRTGFTVIGAGVASSVSSRWHADDPFQDGSTPGVEGWHVRLGPMRAGEEPASLVLTFDDGTGTVLAVLPGFIGTVLVEGGRVVSVNYVPSEGTERYGDYQHRADELERLKAVTAAAARQGRFLAEGEDAAQFASRVRQLKGIDPTMGLYAAYGYAQAGRLDRALDVFRYMEADEPPVPFDVLLLAVRGGLDLASVSLDHVAPFAPMLAQGWSHLSPGDPLHRPVHEALRPHVIPALWTTLAPEGVEIARAALTAGTVW